jgi:hypothetical protein
MWGPVVHQWQCTMGRNKNDCTVSRSVECKVGKTLTGQVLLEMECLRCHMVPKPIMRQECKQAPARKGRPLSKTILRMLRQVNFLIHTAS